MIFAALLTGMLLLVAVSILDSRGRLTLGDFLISLGVVLAVVAAGVSALGMAAG